jgi:arylsulfatase A-like enzyme
MVDEMRGDCLGVAGHPIVRTPRLDQLAAEGAYFPNSYTVSPVCSPARMSLFTGRYRQVHGVLTNGQPGNDDEVTLPLMLKHHGYATGMSGKAHLRGPGTAGIDWYRMFSANDPGFEPNGLSYRDWLRKKHPDFKGNPSAVAVPGTKVEPDPAGLHIGTSPLPDADYQTAWCADRAIEFVKDHADGQRPWFHFCSFIRPHSPFVIPEPYATMYRPEDMILPPCPPDTERIIREEVPKLRTKNAHRHWIADPRILRPLMAHYYGSCTLIDHHTGRLLDALDDSGQRDNTIVIFTSDHGNMMGDKGRLFKGIMYEGSARIPLIVRAPRMESGHRIERIMEITDIAPTILELCGLPVLEGIQGTSFAKQLRDEADWEGWDDVAYSDLRESMIRRGRWKLMGYRSYRPRDTGPDWELYNIAEDPHEERSLITDPGLTHLITDLRAELEKRLAERPPPSKL